MSGVSQKIKERKKKRRRNKWKEGLCTSKFPEEFTLGNFSPTLKHFERRVDQEWLNAL